MRRSIVVTYDISDPRRLRKVFKLMRGYGDHIQLSVFQCELNQMERRQLEVDLGSIIDDDVDQVLFIDLGLTTGRGTGAITSLGRIHVNPEHLAVVA